MEKSLKMNLHRHSLKFLKNFFSLGHSPAMLAEHARLRVASASIPFEKKFLRNFIARTAKNDLKRIFFKGFSLMLVILFLFSTLAPVLAANDQEKPKDSMSQLGKDFGNNFLNETVIQNAQRLAGAACSIYNLGIDFKNFFGPDWSFLQSTLETSVLFRNSSWRDIIWAVNDQYDLFIKQLGALEKKQCSLAIVKGMNPDDPTINAQIDALDLRISEMKAKIKYFYQARWELQKPSPQFFAALDGHEEYQFALKPLETDQIFYWLVDPVTVFKVNRDDIGHRMRDLLVNTAQDLGAVVDQLPELCFASLNVVHDIGLYFVYALEPDPESGLLKDKDGKKYKDFKDFVERNRAKIVKSYGSLCEKKPPRTPIEFKKTDSELQYEKFLDAIDKHLSTLEKRLATISASLSKYAVKKLNKTFSPDDQKVFETLKNMRSELVAMIEYYSLLMSKVGPPTGSLKKLQESLTSFSEALLGLQKDENGGLSSRLNFAERFQKSKEKSLQNICARLEKMYAQTGRDIGDLPVVGSANGFTYCRSRPECQGVNIASSLGSPDGRAKLAACSGFSITGEPPQATVNAVNSATRDIGELLQAGAYNDLLNAKGQHFSSLRSRYEALYKTQDGSAALLENLIRQATTSVADDPELPYNPQAPSGPQTQVGLMKYIYKNLWKFMEKEDGLCLAPEEP